MLRLDDIVSKRIGVSDVVIDTISQRRTILPTTSIGIVMALARSRRIPDVLARASTGEERSS
jgi:hypothetical protein